MNEEPIKIELSIAFNFEVYFTSQVFDLDNPILYEIVNSLHKDNRGTLLFVADQGVLDHHPKLDTHIQRYCDRYDLFFQRDIFILPGGDSAKKHQHVDRLYREMMRLELDRHSFVVAIGGGAVLDSVGYAAATFHRGIGLIRIPTTVLAQNDAGIGVKNGINSYGKKNLIGCFAPPVAVINDSAWLSSLTYRDYRSGFAEAVKVALIRDGKFYQWLHSNAHKLAARNDVACHYLIKRCAELHLQQISSGGDPFEKGSSRPLDYGHWSAHKLESLSNYDLSHGEAVAIGMMLDALYAHQIGILSRPDTENILNLLKALGFTLWHPAVSRESPEGELLLLDGLEEFRQHLGGQLCITLLTGLGTVIDVDYIETSHMLKAIQILQQLSTSTIED